jgi:predicted transposase/invertase (TIGR01784 family)
MNQGKRRLLMKPLNINMQRKKKGREEGLQEGMEKGKLAEREQLIRGMHKNGMDIEDIAKFTNMDLSDVRHILEQ